MGPETAAGEGGPEGAGEGSYGGGPVPPHPTRRSEGFYGRRAGKTLKPAQAGALERHWPRLGLDLSGPPPADLGHLFDLPRGTAPESIALEIGFGGGEHLMHRARRRPETGHIGVEPFRNGMAKLVSAWDAEPLPNIRLHDDDATALLDWLPRGSLDHVDILYPDPWRKPRHHKRRFVGSANLDRLARVLKPGGTLHFASDWPDYVNWTLAHVAAHDAFEWQATGRADWETPYEDWPGTRYEAKAIREGRVPAYLRFTRRA